MVRRTLRFLTAVVVASAVVVLPDPDALARPPVSVQCDEPPVPYCQPVDGTIHDGTGAGVLPQVPGDPSPAAPGIWLGHLGSARYCYANYNPLVIDTDRDWLDDECELTLARAFAPALAINLGDGCALGEPFWGAKYFTNDPLYGWGEFVRIAYMPGYYRDCGAFGHAGDSEFIMLSVHYNPGTQHWEVRDGYLSAHAGTPTNSSEYVRPGSGFEYPTRSLAYPRIWIARSKHGNYRTSGKCDAGAFGADTCDGNVMLGRMRVYRHRNVGSRWVDRFPGGIASENPLYRPSGVSERYYSRANFKGWQPAATGVTPYYDFLYSQTYECFDWTYTFQGGHCAIGPGPNPPTSTKLTGVIDGPAAVTRGQSYTWTTFATGGSRPYHAQWWRKYTSDPQAVLMGASDGTGQFTAGSWTGLVDRCENFRLTVKITSPDGQFWYDDHDVAVTTCPPPPPPPLSVYIDGPGLITAKATYTYTAVTSGFSGPSYTWSERFCASASETGCSAWSTLTGLGNVYTRTLNKDCSGTGENVFQLRVEVTNNDGRSAEAQMTSSLCGLL